MAQQKITADQVDTLNQNTTGTASNVTGTVAVGNGGTGLTSPGTSGNVLTSNGTAWTSAAPSGGSASNTYKEAVRVATTANGALATAYENGDIIDGVTLVTGDRILIKNQTTSSENGIYTVKASGAPTRATDFDTSGAEVSNGVIIPVQFGTVNGGSTWQLVQNGGTIGNNFRFQPLNGIFACNLTGWGTPSASTGNGVAIGSSATAGGNNSYALGTSASAGGSNSVALGTSASAGGNQSVSIGDSSAAGGAGGCAVGLYSVANGANALMLGSYGALGNANSQVGGVIIGSNNRTDFVNEYVFSQCAFPSTLGSAKASAVVLLMQTTNATPTELGTSTPTSLSNTPTNRLVLTNDSSYIFDCDIIARNTATDTETAAFNLKFVIRRGAAAANTAIVGTPVLTILAQDTGTTTWTVGVTADTTNGRPKIEVTGEAAKTIRWVCNIRMTKVSG